MTSESKEYGYYNPDNFLIIGTHDDSDIYYCVNCQYLGKDWIQHEIEHCEVSDCDHHINEEGSPECLCPKCYSRAYFIATDEEKSVYPLIQSIKTVREHIIESEMEGTIDKDDSYYPTLIALGDLLEKLIDESTNQDVMEDFYAGVLVTAAEGGYLNWGWVQKRQSGKLSIELQDPEYSKLEIYANNTVDVSSEHVADAIKNIIAGTTNLNERLSNEVKGAFTELDAGILDAISADCIVQIAVFGELIYG